MKNEQNTPVGYYPDYPKLSFDYYPKIDFSAKWQPLYYVEFLTRTDRKSNETTTWRLFKRQYMFPPEEWDKREHDLFDSNEMHPWNLGGGDVNENNDAHDMNTRSFLKFMVDALNDLAQKGNTGERIY